MAVAQTLGKKIKELRTLKGYTQKALALKGGFSVPSIHLWEQDKQVPSLTSLRRLSTCLNCRIEELTKYIV